MCELSVVLGVRLISVMLNVGPWKEGSGMKVKVLAAEDGASACIVVS